MFKKTEFHYEIGLNVTVVETDDFVNYFVSEKENSYLDCIIHYIRCKKDNKYVLDIEKGIDRKRISFALYTLFHLFFKVFNPFFISLINWVKVLMVTQGRYMNVDNVLIIDENKEI